MCTCDKDPLPSKAAPTSASTGASGSAAATYIGASNASAAPLQSSSSSANTPTKLPSAASAPAPIDLTKVIPPPQTLPTTPSSSGSSYNNYQRNIENVKANPYTKDRVSLFSYFKQVYDKAKQIDPERLVFSIYTPGNPISQYDKKNPDPIHNLTQTIDSIYDGYRKTMYKNLNPPSNIGLNKLRGDFITWDQNITKGYDFIKKNENMKQTSPILDKIKDEMNRIFSEKRDLLFYNFIKTLSGKEKEDFDRDTEPYINTIDNLYKQSLDLKNEKVNTVNAQNILVTAKDALDRLVSTIDRYATIPYSSLPPPSSSSSSSIPLPTRPPGPKTKLTMNLATITNTFIKLQENELFKNKTGTLGTRESNLIDESVAEINEYIKTITNITANPNPTDDQLANAKSLVISAKGALNNILLNLKIPSTDIATVTTVSGGRRTRRGRRAKRSHRRTRRMLGIAK
jgi:hypothetical protein